MKKFKFITILVFSILISGAFISCSSQTEIEKSEQDSTLNLDQILSEIIELGESEGKIITFSIINEIFIFRIFVRDFIRTNN